MSTHVISNFSLATGATFLPAASPRERRVGHMRAEGRDVAAAVVAPEPVEVTEVVTAVALAAALLPGTMVLAGR